LWINLQPQPAPELNIDGFDYGAFAMMKKTLLCLVATIFVSPVFAEVYKWTDANGNTHYDDAPPSVEAEQVIIKKQTDEQIDNGKRIRAETERSKRILEEMENSNRQDAAASPPSSSNSNTDSTNTGTTPASPMRRY
jgi:hypothetical protein